jgi:hypothetical protein
VRRRMLQGSDGRAAQLVARHAQRGDGRGHRRASGASVVDWMVYGHALQICKGDHKTFGKGTCAA